MGKGFPFGGDENILTLIWVMVAKLCKYTKNLSLHFKWVHCMLRE